MQALIFDCDGVLVDSEPVYAQAFSATLANFGLALPAAMLQTSLQGKSMSDCYRWLAKHWQFTVTEAFECALFAETDRLLPERLKPIDGILDVVKSAVVPIAVASNGVRRSVENNLTHCQLVQYFNGHIYTASQVARPKPAPDIYAFAAEKLGVEAEQCAVIEDSVLGVQAALAAKMQVCWLTHGRAVMLDDFTPNECERLTVASDIAAVYQWAGLKGLIA